MVNVRKSWVNIGRVWKCLETLGEVGESLRNVWKVMKSWENSLKIREKERKNTVFLISTLKIGEREEKEKY